MTLKKAIEQIQVKEIKDYEEACEAIKDKFVEKYFNESYNDSHWVHKGVVFYINNRIDTL